MFEKIGHGKRVVLMGDPVINTKELQDIILNNDVALLSFTKDYFSKFYNSMPKVLINGGMIIPANNLDNAFKVAEYRDVMEEILEEIKRQNVTHVVLYSNMWHPYYLAKLKKIGIVLTTKIVDDPEGSSYYSKPIVKYYDKCICSGVYYDKSRTIKEMYYKWGAREVKFLPVFVDPGHYDKDIIDYSKKDVDVVHIGNFNWKRWVLLSMLYKKFGKRILFYSRFDPRKNKGINGFIFRTLNIFFPLPQVKKINDNELKEVYKRSKIGLNKHQSYGPSNARSYELCLNGVMQITDNPKGYRKIYNIRKEIKCYKNSREMVNLVEYYLKHNKEREAIARAGYEKAMANYTYENVIARHLEYILEK